MRYLFVLIFAVCIFNTLCADEIRSQKSEFEIEQGLLDKLYQETVTDNGFKSRLASIEIIPQYSFTFIDQLSLSNDYFTVPYSATTKSLSFFSLTGSIPLLQVKGLGARALGKFGYTFKESMTQVTSKSGGDYTDVVRLHWLPLAVGLKLDYQIPGVSFVKPYVEGSIGAQWLFQSGNLSGLEQSFWVPFYQASFGLFLFSNNNNDNWFGGIVTCYSLRNSFASDQAVKTQSIDLGLNFRL
jgi:hypothetical protein